MEDSFREFLSHFPDATSLDSKEYRRLFGNKRRADFTLFDEKIVCEIKEICDFDAGARAEKVLNKDPSDFKRDMFNTLNGELRVADRQIQSTKAVLNRPNAFGLTIVQNYVPRTFSGLAIFSAADRKMAGGLASTDFLLILDSVNVFQDSEGLMHRFAQTLCRDRANNKEFYDLFEGVLSAYFVTYNISTFDRNLSRGECSWVIAPDRKFKEHRAVMYYEQ